MQIVKICDIVWNYKCLLYFSSYPVGTSEDKVNACKPKDVVDFCLLRGESGFILLST